MALELGEKINAGGTGAVHRGPEGSVYKITNGSEMANADILKEFYVLQELQKFPNIPTQYVLDGGRDEAGRCYIQMNEIDGEPLDEMVHYDLLSVDDLTSIRYQVQDIFSKLGQAGFYHGDAIGTGNYMISRDEQDVKVRIIDFAEGGKDPSGTLAIQEGEQIDGILDRLISQKTYEYERADALTV